MGVSRRTVELIVAAGIFIIGLAIIGDSIHLGIGWSNKSPEPGYFPVRVGCILALASIGIGLQALFDKSSAAMQEFVSWERFRLVLAVFIPTVVYVVLMALIGIYVASALFIAGFMAASRKFNWLSTLAISVGSMCAVFWLFEIEFLVPLPKGPLEAWLGY
jgi:hypothetical protein